MLFIIMHLTSGTVLSIIFQPAHVVDSSEFVKDEDSRSSIEENWTVHQMRTTSNFGMESRLLFWFTGGLNYQIEHHLFPNICHVHYRDISVIVRSTAEKYGLPYFNQKTLASAFLGHLKMLKSLGRGQ